MDIGELVTELRVGVDVDASGTETQMLYEQWLKCDQWALRREAIPLLVGVDPARWPEYLKEFGLAEIEESLWKACSAALSGAINDDHIAPARLKAWAQSRGIAVPVCFGRLMDFITRVLAERPGMPDPGESSGSLTAPARLRDTERVLGAALSMVTKVPDQCRDENGFFDGGRIARLIREKTVLWFDDAEPCLSEVEMAALIDKWLE